MRLHPSVSQQEAYDWLKAQAATQPEAATPTPELEEALRAMAEAMAAVSATVLPDDIEPHFP